MPAYGRVEVTTPGGTGVSPPAAVDNLQNPFSVTLDAIVTGTVSYTIQATSDNIYAAGYVAASGNWYTIPGLGTPATAMSPVTAAYQSPFGPNPATAFRVNQASGAGTVTLRVLQGGRRTA